MRRKLIIITKTWTIPHDLVLEEVKLGSNNTGSALEQEILEMADEWTKFNEPDAGDKKVVIW